MSHIIYRIYPKNNESNGYIGQTGLLDNRMRGHLYSAYKVKRLYVLEYVLHKIFNLNIHISESPAEPYRYARNNFKQISNTQGFIEFMEDRIDVKQYGLYGALNKYKYNDLHIDIIYESNSESFIDSIRIIEDLYMNIHRTVSPYGYNKKLNNVTHKDSSYDALCEINTHISMNGLEPIKSFSLDIFITQEC